MFQLIARHLLHTLNIIVVESFTTPHHYCPMSVQPLPALTVTARADFSGKDIDMFMFAMQLYQIEMYTVEKLQNMK